MFDTLRLSVGRLQSRRALLETQREEYARKLAEGQAGLKQDLANAQASRVLAIAGLNSEIAELAEIALGL